MRFARLAALAVVVLLAAPFAAEAQNAVVHIGLLSLSSPESMRPLVGAFRDGMRELGYTEGQNMILEVRYAAGRAERLSSLAAELVGLKVAVIVAGSSQAIRAAQGATTAIPIVAAGGDLLALGAIKSLARPGGNITGLSNLTIDYIPKLPELLHAAVPQLSRVAVLWNPSQPNRTVLDKLQMATQQMGGGAFLMEARTPSELERAFANTGTPRIDAVIVAPDGFFLQQAGQIGQLATKYRLPCISPYRDIVANGGLISYGRNVAKEFRHAATYVDKILKGANPADLPVEQPTILDVVINLKTARALGLTIPPVVLARADEVIQ